MDMTEVCLAVYLVDCEKGLPIGIFHNFRIDRLHSRAQPFLQHRTRVKRADESANTDSSRQMLRLLESDCIFLLFIQYDRWQITLSVIVT